MEVALVNMKKFLLILSVLAFIRTGDSLASEAQPQPRPDVARQLEAMTWYTEEYPPYNFLNKDGKVTGISTDILLKVFTRLGANITRSDIKLVPWTEGYEQVLRTPNTSLYSMTYTPERERVMKFVGPLVPSHISIMGPKASNIKITSEADLSDLIVGVIKDDIGDQLVKKYALSDSSIQRAKSLTQLIKLLERGRIDVVAYASTVFKYALVQHGFNPEAYQEHFKLKEGHLGFAFHKNTDPGLLGEMQRVVDDMLANGEVDALVKTYETAIP